VKEGKPMSVSEKAKAKLDEASKEIKEAIDNLRTEVTELSNKVKEKLKGTGEEMRETDEEIRITAELPGVYKDSIDVSLTDDRVTIRGEKKEEVEKKGRGHYKVERSYGSFQRSIHLPCGVETDRVDASLRDGVLTVKMPKTAAARERIKKIPVRGD
jgi:HSP20 family protein